LVDSFHIPDGFDPHGKVVRFECQRFFDFEIVLRVFHLKGKALKNQCCYHRSFLPCKRSTNASSTMSTLFYISYHLEPFPKGFQLFGGSFAHKSGAIRSGLNSSGSGPHTFGSRCKAGRRTISPSPSFNSYFPATTVSCRGPTMNAYYQYTPKKS
jgi:hypothetical protein